MMKLIFVWVGLLVIAATALLSQTSSQNPHGKLRWKCEDCHTSESWSTLRQPLNFNHAETGFPLMGAHRSAACIGCHNESTFNHVSTACVDCHTDHHRGRQGETCQNCHTPQDWQNRHDNLELHNQKGFSLTGIHAAVDCDACHCNLANNEYAGTPVDCGGCHEQEFLTASNPDHMRAGFGSKCESCHATTYGGWNKSTYVHPSAFALTGAHKQAGCNNCHATSFAGTSNTCYDCHSTNFASANNPDHVQGNFAHDCTACHSMTAWSPATFDHATSGFPLTGKHASTTCVSCHPTGYSAIPSDCYSCHKNNYDAASNPNHMAAQFPTGCVTCHSTDAWTPSSFNHASSGFALTGSHQSITCNSCHSSGYTVNLPTNCFGCHKSVYDSTSNPNHAAALFSTDCQTCHSTAGWTPATFNHSTTGFALTGLHASATCVSCHSAGYTNTSPACYGCHKNSYDTTSNPNHMAVSFPTDCSICHTASGWIPSTFNHASTGFPLTGLHATTACNSCHAAGYTNTPTACLSCHQNAYDTTSNPNHVAAAFSTDCSSCHTTSGWNPSSYNHSVTGFALTGVHASTSCKSCHAAGYTNTPTACYSCHQSAFSGTTNPDHIAAGFPTDCSLCHTMSGWIPAIFNHSATGFVLTGAHSTTPCLACHASGYTNTSPLCYGCHKNAYDTTSNPNHIASAFPTDCSMCHSTSNWTSATFDHSTTGFALTGAHTATTCLACHAGGYTNTSPLCYGCHKIVYDTTSNPNHIASAFPTDCSICHSTSNWTSATFDHSTTGFVLTGAHTATTCLACHASGYANTSPLCYGCHKIVYDTTSNPNHIASAFPTDCSMCHSTSNWTSATFDHSTTGFVLTGAHTATTCLACHASGYTNTSPLCYGCHKNAYDTTSNPNHIASAFPTDCSICHSTSNWTSATFNHSTTGFALTGLHATTPCISCHANGYTNTPTVCYSCHQSVYNATTNPNHAAANFPTSCQTCHTTSGWTPSTWNHDNLYFPIYSGRHAGQWSVCGDCHTNATNYAVFECILCHTHSKSSTDASHSGVRNYQYNSAACYSCHPRGTT